MQCKEELEGVDAGGVFNCNAYLPYTTSFTGRCSYGSVPPAPEVTTAPTTDGKGWSKASVQHANNTTPIHLCDIVHWNQLHFIRISFICVAVSTVSRCLFIFTILSDNNCVVHVICQVSFTLLLNDFLVSYSELCYPIHHSYCSNVNWKAAFLPNYMGHTTLVSCALMVVVVGS